jgi:hypothetical protein
MGLKDKAKGIWKKMSELDEENPASQAASKDAGRIPYKDISKKLKDMMRANVDVVGRKIIIPSYYEIYFSANDRKIRAEVEDVLCEELKEELYHEIRKINPEQNKRELTIKAQTDSALLDGEFRIEYHINKPDGSTTKPVVEKTPTPAPVIPPDMDYQQTVIEQAPLPEPDDAKTIVMQKPTSQAFYTLLVDSGDDKRDVAITKTTITIGRGAKDDVSLNSPDFSISRAHASMTVRDGHFFLTPAGINGTSVNGHELELNKETEVQIGDDIKIMNYSLKILAAV